MHDNDSRIPGEISIIQGEQMSDAMNTHRSCQPRIVDLDALDPVRDHQLPPLGMDAWIIGQIG